MRIVVQKYGGSSVADLEKLAGVAKRIAETRARGFAVVVVVSAMGNTTNELISLARQVTQRPDRRELDMLISVGERVSMALLAMALRDLGVPAKSLTGSQSGIITDESHADAKVLEVRPQRVLDSLAEEEVVIVAGFQGVSRAREVTTLGRGGSDTTAVVLAAALGAEYCEICSDVDGIWSADPRVVPSATPIAEMSLDEALALARGGAKVLFEDAVCYARDHGVDIIASSTFGPGAGTRLRTYSEGPPRAVAVTGDGQLVRLATGDATSLVKAIGQAGGRIRRRAGETVYVDGRNSHGGLSELGGVDVAVVTAVGSSLGEAMELTVKADEALTAAQIPILGCGSSGDEAWWEVEGHHLDQAVRLVHQSLLQ